jgi:hypothetical protein
MEFSSGIARTNSKRKLECYGRRGGKGGDLRRRKTPFHLSPEDFLISCKEDRILLDNRLKLSSYLGTQRQGAC